MPCFNDLIKDPLFYLDAVQRVDKLKIDDHFYLDAESDIVFYSESSPLDNTSQMRYARIDDLTVIFRIDDGYFNRIDDRESMIFRINTQNR